MKATENNSSKIASGSLADPGAGRIEGLDGLRAVAVLSVLAFHFWPTAFPGGFLGVDVFFVISGFLITTLLLRERNKKGRVDLLAFWKRRARRLLPALIVVVAISVAAARVVSSDLLINIKRQVFGALTFSTNWVEIIAGVDYFDDSSRSLFVTFWSLAVEEQFYLFWPLLFVGFVALIKKPTILSFIALTAAAVSASLMAILYDPAVSPTRIYYGTDTHSFGLMIGVALAFAFAVPVRLLVSRPWKHIRRWAGFLMLAGLMAIIFIIDGESAFTYQGGILLASVLSAVAVAVLPGEETYFTSLCRLRPVAWIGERSYGLYLWHWPVLLIVSEAMPAVPVGEGPGWATVLIVAIVTFGLTEASYRWIEAPIRKHGFRATWANVRGAFQRPGRELLGPVSATSSALIIVAIATVGFVTAPDKSQAQLSVEAGQKAMEAQNIVSKETTQDTGSGTSKETENSESAPAWPRNLPVPPGDYIVGLGDSVMSGAAPAIYERFPGIYLNAKPILQWHDAPGIVRQMIKEGTMRQVVILNYGTNAGFKNAESELALREVLELLGPKRRVVLVTIVGISGWIPSTNETLHQISAEYPNTVVAEWNEVIQKRPELLHKDKTHPNDEGIVVFADVLSEAMEKLGPG